MMICPGCGTDTRRASGVCLQCDPARWARILDMCQGTVMQAARRHGVSHPHISAVRAMVRSGQLQPPSDTTTHHRPNLSHGAAAAMYRELLALAEQGVPIYRIAAKYQRPIAYVYNALWRARKERRHAD